MRSLKQGMTGRTVVNRSDDGAGRGSSFGREEMGTEKLWRGGSIGEAQTDRSGVLWYPYLSIGDGACIRE